MPTPNDENLEARIDRDRRREEDDLLALLLLFFLTARTHAYSAARLGMNPLQAVADVLVGNYTLGLQGMWQRLSLQIRRSWVAGYRRTVLIVPEPTRFDPAGVAVPVDTDSLARQYVGQMLGTLQRRIGQSIAGSLWPGDVQAAVRDGLRTGGYLDGSQPGWLLNTIAITVTGKSYMGGFMAGFQRPAAREVLYGFEHVSTLDHRTSEICENHAHTRLPADDPFWLTNTPPLHWHCRSYLRPLFHPFIATDYPEIAPEPGFGAAPGLWGQTMYPAA